MSDEYQVRTPLEQRIVTDVNLLTPEYREYLEAKADEARERQLAREAREARQEPPEAKPIPEVEHRRAS